MHYTASLASLVLVLAAGCANADLATAPQPAARAPDGQAAAVDTTPSAEDPGAASQAEPRRDTPPGGYADLAAACPGADALDVSSAEACTEIGCRNGFALDIGPLEAWPAGSYRYLLNIDGEEVSCEGSLPLKACGKQSMTCSSPGVAVEEVGCALDASAHAFGGVAFDGFPAAVELRIEHEGRTLADEQFVAEYGVSQPNGPGCGSVCCFAAGAVELSF